MNITVKEMPTKILNPLSSDTTVDITCFDKYQIKRSDNRC